MYYIIGLILWLILSGLVIKTCVQSGRTKFALILISFLIIPAWPVFLIMGVCVGVNCCCFSESDLSC